MNARGETPLSLALKRGGPAYVQSPSLRDVRKDIDIGQSIDMRTQLRTAMDYALHGHSSYDHAFVISKQKGFISREESKQKTKEKG